MLLVAFCDAFESRVCFRLPFLRRSFTDTRLWRRHHKLRAWFCKTYPEGVSVPAAFNCMPPFFSEHDAPCMDAGNASPRDCPSSQFLRRGMNGARRPGLALAPRRHQGKQTSASATPNAHNERG
jgi:hypothetical protein